KSKDVNSQDSSITRPAPHGEGLLALVPPEKWEEDLGYVDEEELAILLKTKKNKLNSAT
ncbi:unnamed protein product, partial [Ceratitis capitata]